MPAVYRNENYNFKTTRSTGNEKTLRNSKTYSDQIHVKILQTW